MRLGRVPDGDRLFRLCVYPIAFNSKGTSFAHEKMWLLRPMSDGALHGSLAWERYVPTVEYVHAYGCRLASGINDNKRKKGMFKEKHRHYYCGAYEMRGQAVRALAITPQLDEIESADVIHQIEAGEIAHTDLRICLKPGCDISDIEATKTAIVDRLWNACSGPLRHICNSDHDIPEHRSSNLTTAPAGEYQDVRIWFFRVLRIMRFQLFRRLWVNSIPSAGTSSWPKIKFQICNWLWRCVSQE